MIVPIQHLSTRRTVPASSKSIKYFLRYMECYAFDALIPNIDVGSTIFVPK